MTCLMLSVLYVLMMKLTSAPGGFISGRKQDRVRMTIR